MKLAGVLVMGGLNTRMNGTKKAFLHYNGEPFYKHITTALSSIDKIYMSVDDKANYTNLNLNFEFVEDIYKTIGPMGGIHSTFVNCKEDAFLFVPSDTPLLDKKIIDKIISEFHKTNKNVILQENNRLHPLIAIYKKDCLDVVIKSINNDSYSLLNIAAEVEYTTVVFEDLELDKNVLLDCNDEVTYNNLIKGTAYGKFN